MDLHNRASKGLTTSLPDSEALSSSSRGAFFLFVAFAAETASNEGFEGIFKVAIGLSLFLFLLVAVVVCSELHVIFAGKSEKSRYTTMRDVEAHYVKCNWGIFAYRHF